MNDNKNILNKNLSRATGLLGKNTFLGFGVTLIWSLIFYKLTREVWEKETLNFDIKVSEYIYQLRTENLTNFFKFITNFGGYYLVIFTTVVIAFLLLKRRYLRALWFFLPIAVSFVLNLIFKQLVGRTRPIISQIIPETDYSFPSGHSSGSVIFYAMSVALIFKMTNNLVIRILSLVFFSILVFLILFSRIYLGVHFLTDIIGGAIQSIIVFSVFWNVNRIYRNRRS